MTNRTLRYVVAILTLAVSVILGVPGAAQATPSQFRIQSSLSFKCLTAWGSGDGAVVTQAPCGDPRNPNPAQRWVVDPGGVGRIVNVGTGKCLDLWGSQFSNATLVFTWSCYQLPDGRLAPSQLWRSVNRGGLIFELRPFVTDKCLDLAGDNQSDGAVIQQWGCNPGNNVNQKWIIA